MSILTFSLTSAPGPQAEQRFLHAARHHPRAPRVRLWVLFVSASLDLPWLCTELRSACPQSRILATTVEGEFSEHGASQGGVSGFALCGEELTVSCGLGARVRHSVEAAVDAACEPLHNPDPAQHHVALLLVDAMVSQGEEVALLSALRLGPSVALAGGASTDGMQSHRSLVSTGTRTESDSIAIALISSPAPIAIGLAHGHEPSGEGATVTRSEGAVVHAIDHRPAWEVFHEAIEANGPPALPESERGGAGFLRYSARFGTGLRTDDGYKLRTALAPNPDGSLTFVCEIPEGTRFEFMRTSPEQQIEAGRRAAREALEGLGGHPVAGVLVFECACRQIILGPRFPETVASIASVFPDTPMAGGETYGEIALRPGSLSAFHNTTSVVVAFARR